MQTLEERISTREGAVEEFDPARQAHFVLAKERLHVGLATESLVECLLNSAGEPVDVMALPLPDSERNLLAAILMKENEELTVERLEGAVRALRRIQYRRQMDSVQQELQGAKKHEPDRLRFLLREKDRLKRALMDPAVSDPGASDPGASAQGPVQRPA
jgi:hypothetical protein